MKNLRLTFLLLCITISIGFSQPPPPGDPDPNNNGGGNPTVPISGIEFLLGAGCLIGLKRSINYLKGLRKAS